MVHLSYMGVERGSFEPGMWEIAVLALLRERPMHPYQMQRLLRLRHKDEVLVLKRGSLYHAIRRLVDAGLIAVEATGREGNRPERTTYRIRPAGLEAFVNTLRRIVATPRREASEFMAAMSFLVHLEPEEAAKLLDERAQRLVDEMAERAAGLATARTHVGRINLLESEYLMAMKKAELAWVRGVKEEIRKGGLRWDLEAILREARLRGEYSRERSASRKSKKGESDE
jgi:DNA-binding PadR family transcriptional regulator